MVTTEVAKFKLRVLKHVSNVVKNGASIPPVMYVRTIKGKYKIMPVAPQLMQDKALRDKCREIMQHMLNIAKVDLMCFVSEAYVSAINAKELTPEERRRAENNNLNEEDYKKIIASRQECVFLSFEAKGLKEENELMTFKVKDKNLLPHELMAGTDTPINSATEPQGNFQNILAQ
jgi:hypothetical protein